MKKFQILSRLSLSLVAVCLFLASMETVATGDDNIKAKNRAAVAAKKRRDANLSNAKKKIKSTLNRVLVTVTEDVDPDASSDSPSGKKSRVKKSKSKRASTDHFVVALLNVEPKTKKVSAKIVSYPGVEEGTENILAFLKATSNSQVRDFKVISRHSSSPDADEALEYWQGRESEIANNIKTELQRIDNMKKQYAKAQARARAQYIAARKAQQRLRALKRALKRRC